MGSIKKMLFGISIMLLGGFIMMDPSSDLGGFEFFIVLVGFVLSLVGFIEKEKS